jgi:sugar phosphate isomerase/epimerase
MFRNLVCGTLGVGADFAQAIAYAKLGQFGGVDISSGDVEQLGAETIKSALAEADLQLGACGLPVSWMGSEEDWQASLAALPAACKLAQSVGATRYATWVPSWNDELDWAPNFERHVTRFRPIAQIMADHGIRLGLEFLGPKTLRDGHPYEFISTAAGMLDLCRAIGTGNVGLLLDAWHWYTSGGTLADLATLTNADIVYVHINDAPEGIALDEQLDNVRRLPGETGVIDLTGFLQALRAANYDGPVTPEPFSERVRSLPPDEAIQLTGSLFKGVWDAAGV